MIEPSVTISVRAAELAANCVEACANDGPKPERYRSWYREVADDLRHGIAMAKEKMMTPTLLAKLGSIVVHLQECDLANTSATFDLVAVKALAADPEVSAWLATIDPVLLPVKR